MNYQNSPIFAALKIGKNIIIGKVLTLGDNGLTFESVSYDHITPDTIHLIDVFSSDKYYYHKLPVEVISDDKYINEKSFTKMITRNIKVKYHDAEIVKNNVSIRSNSKSESNSVIEKLVKWRDGIGDAKPIYLSEAETQEMFRWMSTCYGKDKKTNSIEKSG